MLNLDFGNDDDVPMHDAPLERQASVAAREGELLVNAFESSVSVPPEKAVAALHADGVAAVDSVIDGTTATSLRDHVNELLAQCLDRDDPDATGSDGGEALLGAIMCRRNRWDVKLSLDDPIVDTALTQTLAALGRPLAKLLGAGCQLFELGALAVDEGAPRQPVHPDTPHTRRRSVVTCLVALQDVELSMGPTHFLPRTHTERDRAAQWGADPADDEDVAEVLADSACRIPLPRRGDAVLFDARTLHCGSAHTRKHGPRRILFYCSFRARFACNHWCARQPAHTNSYFPRISSCMCMCL